MNYLSLDIYFYYTKQVKTNKMDKYKQIKIDGQSIYKQVNMNPRDKYISYIVGHPFLI